MRLWWRPGGPESIRGRAFARVPPIRYGPPMATTKGADAQTILADLRERVRVLDERVTVIGRHL